MNDPLQSAKENLLLPSNLSLSSIESVLDSMLGQGVNSADLYFQSCCNESWLLEDGIVKNVHYGIKRGVGVRAISADKTGFAYCDDIILPMLKEAAKSAKAIAKQGSNYSLPVLQRHKGLTLYHPLNPINSLSESSKVALLQQVEQQARRQDHRIKEVVVSLAANYDTILVVASDGSFAADIRPLVRLNVSVIIEDHHRREQGYFGCGGRYGYDCFLKDNLALHCAKQAVREAIVNLEAIPAPAGLMPVVLGPGWPGVLLHEAIGHGLEGDFNRKGSSAFSGRLGQRVASPLCTVVDDGTLAGRRGSLNIDDEGVPTQYTTLIEKGVLKNYMQDKHNASLMKMQSTGNGRRESYAHVPLPRMTNTYMLAGSHDPKEIIASVKKGLYAVNFGGGQVDITSGNFVFSASEAYLIENGKITQPVKGATLIGHGPTVLTKVSMVGNDLKLDSGIGTCGKEGQNVPVGVGQPTLLIDNLTVGGTAQQ